MSILRAITGLSRVQGLVVSLLMMMLDTVTLFWLHGDAIALELLSLNAWRFGQSGDQAALSKTPKAPQRRQESWKHRHSPGS